MPNTQFGICLPNWKTTTECYGYPCMSFPRVPLQPEAKFPKEPRWRCIQVRHFHWDDRKDGLDLVRVNVLYIVFGSCWPHPKRYSCLGLLHITFHGVSQHLLNFEDGLWDLIFGPVCRVWGPEWGVHSASLRELRVSIKGLSRGIWGPA